MSIPLDPFRDETEPTAAAITRVVTRARSHHPRWSRWWLIAGLGLGAAALAQVNRPPADASFDGPVDARTRGGSHLTGDASARVSGEEIELSAGTITATDGRFLLRTREAEVRGDGAIVRLDRDVMGTRVRVDRGGVDVRCGDGAAVSVSTEMSCLPTSAEGMLARAAALPPDARIKALDDAVRLATTPTTEAEARFQRALAHLDAPAAALADLEAAERTGASARPDDLARALARLYVAAERCDAALPRLEALQARGALGDDAALLDRCKTTRD